MQPVAKRVAEPTNSDAGNSISDQLSKMDCMIASAMVIRFSSVKHKELKNTKISKNEFCFGMGTRENQQEPSRLCFSDEDAAAPASPHKARWSGRQQTLYFFFYTIVYSDVGLTYECATFFVIATSR